MLPVGSRGQTGDELRPVRSLEHPAWLLRPARLRPRPRGQADSGTGAEIREPGGGEMRLPALEPELSLCESELIFVMGG